MKQTDPAPAGLPWAGVLVATGLTAAAYAAHFLPFAPFQVGAGEQLRRPISPEILAIVLGVALRNLLPVPGSTSVVARGIVKKILPFTIVLMGASVEFARVRELGGVAFGITLAGVVAAIVAARLAGPVAGLTPVTSLLIGAGTAICGNSAIVAVAPVVKARDDELVLSLGAINLIGLVAMIALPFVGRALLMTDPAFGLWAGATVHSVPQAVAAGFAFSTAAGAVATVVKVARVTLLAPFVLLIVWWRARTPQGDGAAATKVNWWTLIPWFLWGFLVVAIARALGALPTISVGGGSLALDRTLTELGKVLLTLAMVAIGLEVHLAAMARVGLRALGVGLLAATVLILGSLALVRGCI